MDENEFVSRKDKLCAYVAKAGIDKDEVIEYLKKEFEVSQGIGMNADDSRTRSMIATVNYYRKYLDKMGNRVKFICLGMSQPTDYGLSKKFRDIKKQYQVASQIDRDEMMAKNIVNSKGIPLHNANTTVIEDKYGQIINLNDEMSQSLIGLVENDDGNTFPAIVKVYGKNGCESKKEMYRWGAISGEQSNTKAHPGYVVLNTRDPNFTATKDSKRIEEKEYSEIIETKFQRILYDVDENDFKTKVNEASGGYLVLKNGRMLDYSHNLYGITSSLRSEKSALDIEASNIAELRINSAITLDVDPATKDKIWLFCYLRNNKDNTDMTLKLDVLGMYTNEPIDKEKFEMDVGFMDNDEKLITEQPVGSSMSASNSKFFDDMEKRNL